MTSLMLVKFLPFTKAARADVNTISRFTYGICTFYANRVGQIAPTGVTLDLKTRLVHNCWLT